MQSQLGDTNLCFDTLHRVKPCHATTLGVSREKSLDVVAQILTLHARVEIIKTFASKIACCRAWTANPAVLTQDATGCVTVCGAQNNATEEKNTIIAVIIISSNWDCSA